MNRIFGRIVAGALVVAAPWVVIACRPDSGGQELPWQVEGTVSKEDGSVDSGYGFVPSATEGAYVQLFESGDFTGRALEQVCICWLKTRGESEVVFEVVVYEDAGGRPAGEPIVAVPGSAAGVAQSVETAGSFVCVDIDKVPIPQGRFFVGARWDPSDSQFAFICNDQTPETPFAETYFYEDRSPDWTDVRQSRDPIFLPHRAIMVRVLAERPERAAPGPD